MHRSGKLKSGKVSLGVYLQFCYQATKCLYFGPKNTFFQKVKFTGQDNPTPNSVSRQPVGIIKNLISVFKLIAFSYEDGLDNSASSSHEIAVWAYLHKDYPL